MALRGACLEVASGNHDMALVLGVEKLFCDNTAKPAAAMASGTGALRDEPQTLDGQVPCFHAWGHL